MPAAMSIVTLPPRLCIDHGSNNVPRPRSTDDGADDAEDVAVDEHATGEKQQDKKHTPHVFIYRTQRLKCDRDLVGRQGNLGPCLHRPPPPRSDSPPGRPAPPRGLARRDNTRVLATPCTRSNLIGKRLANSIMAAEMTGERRSTTVRCGWIRVHSSRTQAVTDRRGRRRAQVGPVTVARLTECDQGRNTDTSLNNTFTL